MSLQPLQTADGSWTVEDTRLGVTYRSLHGAMTEARHVFLGGTRLLEEPPPWRVLELGFGAATNFCETVAAVLEHPNGSLDYHAVDAAPIPPELLRHPHPEARALAQQALAAPGAYTACDGRIALTLYRCRFEAFQAGPLAVDSVYHDPFGPEVQPTSWSPEIFTMVRRHMRPRARLATYSAAGHVRRALQTAGFTVQRVPGPPGKRHVVVAEVP